MSHSNLFVLHPPPSPPLVAYHLRHEETDWFDKPREVRLESARPLDRRQVRLGPRQRRGFGGLNALNSLVFPGHGTVVGPCNRTQNTGI